MIKMSIAITVKINKNMIEKYLTIEGFETKKDSKNKLVIIDGLCFWLVGDVRYYLTQVDFAEKKITYFDTEKAPKFAVQMQNIIERRAIELGFKED